MKITQIEVSAFADVKVEGKTGGKVMIGCKAIASIDGEDNAGECYTTLQEAVLKRVNTIADTLPTIFTK